MDLAAGLAFAAVLEAVAFFCWLLACASSNRSSPMPARQRWKPRNLISIPIAKLKAALKAASGLPYGP